jgi:hypothetical protein
MFIILFTFLHPPSRYLLSLHIHFVYWCPKIRGTNPIGQCQLMLENNEKNNSIPFKFEDMGPQKVQL